MKIEVGRKCAWNFTISICYLNERVLSACLHITSEVLQAYYQRENTLTIVSWTNNRMADLWGALEETPVPEEKPVQTIVIATPNEVVTQDLVNNGKIQSETEQLRTSMNCSALIVVAAYKVADYVPNLQKDDHREFWQTQVSLSRRLSMKTENVEPMNLSNRWWLGHSSARQKSRSRCQSACSDARFIYIDTKLGDRHSTRRRVGQNEQRYLSMADSNDRILPPRGF